MTDAETGENLLDPASENFIGEEAVAVSYKGERYGIVTEPSAPASRFNMPRPLALRLERDPYYSSLEELQGWHLSFGRVLPDGQLPRSAVYRRVGGRDDDRGGVRPLHRLAWRRARREEASSGLTASTTDRATITVG